MPKEHYLGDGLYVSVDHYDMKLRAPREGGDHWVVLDETMFGELVQWAERIGFNVPRKEE